MKKNQFKSAYSEKLRDPRWQKKRLEVMQRDNFACRCCGDSESTLNVHHLRYFGEPWEAPDNYLVTLCEGCHAVETQDKKIWEDNLIKAIQGHTFLSTDFAVLTEGFFDMKPFHVPDVMAATIRFALTSPDIMIELQERFFESLANKNKE